MQEQEKLELLRTLNAGRDALGEALDGVTEEQAARKPLRGWSILECVEHTVKAEQYLLSM